MAAVDSSISASDALEYRRESARLSLSRVSSLPGDDTTAWVREKFASLPQDDVVDASYSCALVKGILLQGRMYVTKTAILFYAKIFGRVTKEHLPLTSIRSVQKRKSGLIANAIKVTFVDPNAPAMVFGSLNRRERACAFIMARLLEVNPAAEPPRDGDEDCSAEEYENSARSLSQSRAISEDHFRSKSVPGWGPGGNARNVSGLLAESAAVDKDWDVAVGTGEGFVRANTDSVVSSGKASAPSSGASRCGSVIEGEVAPILSGVDEEMARRAPVPRQRDMLWRVDDDVVDRFSGNEYSKRKEQARRVIAAPVHVVFDLLFAGNFILKVHEKNGNSDCSETSWTRGDDGFMTRTLRFSRALGYRIGPKATRVVETHRYSFTSDGGALVEFSGHNLDVPMGDSFRVESYIELKPAGENGQSTLLVASVAVHFTKSTMLRSKIEAGALAETKNTMSRLLGLAEERVAAEHARAASPIDKEPSSSESLREPLMLTQDPGASSPPGPLKRVRSKDASSAIRTMSLSNSPDSGVPAREAGTHRGLESAPQRAGDAGTGLKGSHTRSGSNGGNSSVAVDVPSSSSAALGNVNGLRIVIVALLAVIAFLLLICIALLAQLQRDIRRMEHFALLRQADFAPAGLRNGCSG